MSDQKQLAEGDTAPEFRLPDHEGNEVSLSDYRGRHVLVYFYPAAGTPGCTKQACDFRDNLAELNEAGFAVLGISPDSPTKLAKFAADEGINFPLLSDDSREIHAEWGAYGVKKNYGREYLGVIRSTFVVDQDGKIAKAMYNVRATGHVAKLRKDLNV